MSGDAQRRRTLEEIEEEESRDPFLFLKEPLDIGALCEGGADLELDFDRINDEAVNLETPPPDAQKEAQTRGREYSNMSHAAFDAEDDDDDTDMTPFEAIRRKMTSLTSDGGVTKQVLQQGVGDVVPRGNTVFYHYSLFLEYADEPFDCSRLRDEIMKVTISTETDTTLRVIHGLDIGLASMRKSEMARFLISPDYAYGKLGIKPRIPEESTIMAEVELLNFMATGSAEEYLRMPISERKDAPFEMCRQAVVAIRNKGNELFKQKRYDQASQKYQKAVRLLEDARLADEADERKMQKELVKNLVNCALAYSKECSWRRVITCCNEAIKHDPQLAKPYYLKGKALRNLNDLARSRNCLLEARKLKPDDSDISKELSALNKKMEANRAGERVLCERMFNFGPNPKKDQSKPNGASDISKSKGDSNKDIDPEFEAMFRDTLRELKDDNSRADFVCRSTEMTGVQLAYARTVAEDMGFSVEERGEGNDYQVRVKKPHT